MKFLANENIAGPSISLLRKNNIDIISIAETTPGATDHEVMELADKMGYVILTHDSDYGELIYKHGYRPKGGVIYFRLLDFEPQDVAVILLQLINKKISFSNRLTVVDGHALRQRKY